MYTRRQFLKLGAAVGAGVMLPLKLAEKAFAFNLVGQALPANPLLLTKYFDPMPIMGAMPAAGPGYYEVQTCRFLSDVHSQMPPVTTWGYRPAGWTPGATPEPTYLGPSFVNIRGVPIDVKWINNLMDGAGNPLPHPTPVDPSIHWCNPLGETFPAPGSYPVDALGQSTFDYTLPTVPISVHVHGGEQRGAFDGHPDAWFAPGYAITGPAWPGPVFTYENEQPAATIWYHDHALGLDRLTVYMGTAGAYVIVDPPNEPALPPGCESGGPCDIPLVIQDRIFDVNGQLYYPAISDNPTIHPYWIPEFFGDTMLVNGKVWPYMDVEPRAYRFRFLNGSNARHYAMWLEDLTTGTPGPKFTQIATDGGYMPAPAVLNDPAVAGAPKLVMAPGERCEIIIDFSGVAPGTTLTLRNNARSPWPGGTPADPQTTGQIMQFRVAGTPQPAAVVPATPNPGYFALGAPSVTRIHTLNEVMGPGGPTEALLNNTHWDMPATELPKAGATEDWVVVNLTADGHPIHLHLVQFQLISRQKFDLKKYMKAYAAAYGPGGVPMDPMGPPAAGNPDPTPFLKGAPTPAPPEEMGWKDTIKMPPGEVTKIRVRFAPIGSAAVTPYPFDETASPGYVWHCHILEHEENDMMRPYYVVP